MLDFTTSLSDLSDLSDFEEDEESGLGVEDNNSLWTQADSLQVDEIIENPEDGIPSSDGPVMSSPVKGTREERKQKLREKAAKKRKATIQKTQEQASKAAATQLEDHVHDVLDFLAERGIHFGEFLKFIFDPSKGQGNVRWHEFFARRGDVSQILDWWTSSGNGQTGRDEVASWAVTYVAKLVAKEARKVTESKILQTKDTPIDQEFVTTFSFESMHKKLMDLAPIGMQIINAFSTSPSAEKKHKERRKERTKTIITSTALTCLGEYSHSNNIAKRLIGLYLYASGAQRQTISVLSTLGLSESYSNIIRKKNRKPSKSTKSSNTEMANVPSNTSSQSRSTGTLFQLSESMRVRARSIAAHGCYSGVYDNINLTFKVAEQVIGRHDTQQNGTCATLVPLFQAKIENLKTADYQKNFLGAPPLKLSDILHTPEESKTFKKNLIFTILRIIVNHGGDGFQKYKSNLTASQPQSQDKIALHKTELFPLPAWQINESTILGNIEVDEAFRTELNLDNIPDSAERLRFYAGDQLSFARFRAIENVRAGQETGFAGFFGATWIPGLFHVKMADAHGVLTTHWGKPNTGTRNPGSLWFHNTRLDRLPITLTSLPSFRVIRDITFVSLYARVLHCLLLIAQVPTLDAYLKKYDNWDTLVSHAEQIYNNYARTMVVDELRQKRAQNVDQHEGKSTVVFENAVLFMRDALISREFTDAIKSGDSGRIVLVLKVWALSFRGNGRTKYAYEMLHLLHHLSSIWGKELQTIVLNNWLVNPTGNPESWVELDLMQEHLNYWIKVFYKAHGSNASWEWLHSISPCVDVLRQLAKHFNDVLGADQGTFHPPTKLVRDLDTLMSSLDEHDVYRTVYGPILDDDDPPTKDSITSGFHSATASPKNPITDYNEAFIRLQARRRMVPVSEQAKKREPTVPASSPGPQHQSSETTPPVSDYPPSSSIPQTTEDPFTEVTHTFDPFVQASEDDETLTEYEQILQDIQDEVTEPTLSTLGMEDVELDMDNVFVFDDDQYDDLDSESDESDGVDE